MASPRVYVTQDEERFDLSDLERYGQIITLFTRSNYPDEIDVRMPWLVARANKVLNNESNPTRPFNPNSDFVALVGDPLTIAVVFMVLGARGVPRVRALKYDGRERAYYEATIEIKGAM